MQLYGNGAQKSTPNDLPSPTYTLEQIANRYRFATDERFQLRSRVYQTVVKFSCRLGAALGNYWTPPITGTELASVFGRAPRTMNRIMLSLVDEGNLERKRTPLPWGGWGWSYQAIDITEPQLPAVKP